MWGKTLEPSSPPPSKPPPLFSPFPLGRLHSPKEPPPPCCPWPPLVPKEPPPAVPKPPSLLVIGASPCYRLLVKARFFAGLPIKKGRKEKGQGEDHLLRGLIIVFPQVFKGNKVFSQLFVDD